MKKIIAIGDSITFGYPMGIDYSWTSYANKKLNLNIINKGIPGDETIDLLNRFNKDVISNKPDLVIISIGGNDAFRGISIESAKRNILNMVSILKENNIEFIFGETLYTEDNIMHNNYIREFNNFLKNNFSEIIPFNDYVMGYEDSYIDDIHPTIIGYERMGKAFVDYYNKYLK